MRRRLLSSAVFFGSVSLAAQAPVRQPDAVPFEVATRLIAASGNGADPLILVGAVPDQPISRLYIPPNARILGSTSTESSVIVVMTIPVPSDSIVLDFKREMLKKGWTEPSAVQQQFMGSNTGGFRSMNLPTFTGSIGRATLCGGGDQQVMVISSTRRRANTDITLRLNNAFGPPCKALPYTTFRPSYPTLYNPVGLDDARSYSQCGFSGGGSTTSTTLFTTLSSNDLLDHYARQMRDSGWAEPRAGTTLVGRSFVRPDSAGVPVEVSLLVARSMRDSSCTEVNMQARQGRKP